MSNLNELQKGYLQRIRNLIDVTDPKFSMSYNKKVKIAEAFLKHDLPMIYKQLPDDGSVNLDSCNELRNAHYHAITKLLQIQKYTKGKKSLNSRKKLKQLRNQLQTVASHIEGLSLELPLFSIKGQFAQTIDVLCDVVCPEPAFEGAYTTKEVLERCDCLLQKTLPALYNQLPPNANPEIVKRINEQHNICIEKLHYIVTHDYNENEFRNLKSNISYLKKLVEKICPTPSA
jgi:hypothetical protein